MRTLSIKHLLALVLGSVLSFIAGCLLVSAFMSKSHYPDVASLLIGLILAGMAAYLFAGAPPLSGVATRVLFAVGFGFLTPLAFIVGAEPFEVVGQDSIRERVAGCVLVFFYSATCQFWLLRKSKGGFQAAGSIFAGMVGSLIAACAQFVQGGIHHNWPMIVSCGIGGIAGYLLSVRRDPAEPKLKSRQDDATLD